ncbi:hypothetical protein Droror1_Dr00016273 [Drosera rotundifolia]
MGKGKEKKKTNDDDAIPLAEFMTKEKLKKQSKEKPKTQKKDGKESEARREGVDPAKVVNTTKRTRVVNSSIVENVKFFGTENHSTPVSVEKGIDTGKGKVEKLWGSCLILRIRRLGLLKSRIIC